MVISSPFLVLCPLYHLPMNLVSSVPESPYILRYLAYAIATKAKQSVFDFQYFPFRVLKRDSEEAELERNLISSTGSLPVSQSSTNQTVDNLVRTSDTLSFLVLKDGKLVYEYYADGINGKTPMLCYSITKSLFSSYLSLLAANGVISFDDLLGQYHCQLPDFVANRTFQSLMNMESGIRYTHGKGPFTDMVKFWLSTDIRRSLKEISPSVDGSGFFYYNDIHLHLLNRMVDSRISDLFVDINHNFWQRLKPTSNALFCIDSHQKKYLKMDGGMVVAPYDLAKFGLLYADNGLIYNSQVLSEDWCRSLKTSDGVRTDSDFWDLYRQMNHSWYPILKQGRTYYKNFWWGLKQDNAPNDIYAMGILGQFVYVSTKNNVVIVRQGNSWGVNGWWPYMLEEIASKIEDI